MMRRMMMMSNSFKCFCNNLKGSIQLILMKRRMRAMILSNMKKIMKMLKSIKILLHLDIRHRGYKILRQKKRRRRINLKEETLIKAKMSLKMIEGLVN